MIKSIQNSTREHIWWNKIGLLLINWESNFYALFHSRKGILKIISYAHPSRVESFSCRHFRPHLESILLENENCISLPYFFRFWKRTFFLLRTCCFYLVLKKIKMNNEIHWIFPKKSINSIVDWTYREIFFKNLYRKKKIT